MNMTEIKAKATSLGLPVGKMRKAELIRAIQTKEGNFPCFETAKEYCSQKACCWRDACLPSKKTIKGWEKKKKTYTKKVTDEVKSLKKQIADLESKAKKMVGAGKKEALNDISKLKAMMTTFSKKTQKVGAASEDAWKITKKGIDEAWKDMSTAFKKATKKLKQR